MLKNVFVGLFVVGSIVVAAAPSRAASSGQEREPIACLKNGETCNGSGCCSHNCVQSKCVP